LVEGSPMLFRGLPMPCPVLIKGEVLPGEQGVRPNIVLTVEKGYLDENDVWHVVEAECPVPETELDWNPEEDVWWDNQAGVWRFRMVWNQQLPRTQFSPYLERYRLRAYALCNRSDSAAVADFRVMSMAKPSQAGISSDYTESNRPAPSMRIVAYVDEDSSGMMAVPIDVDAGWGGPHLGIDYAAQAGAVVNSSEVGVLEDKPLPKPESDEYIGIVHERHRQILAAIYYTAQEYISMGYVVRIRCLPESASRVAFKHSYLGPHRVLKHGMVNLSLKFQHGSTPDEQYERDEVSSAYCHAVIAPQGLPSAGEMVDISVAITRVGDYYVADPSRPRESRQLSLGYVEFQDVILLMEYWTGNTWDFVEEWRATVRVPSLDGPHLHFEVRRKSKKDEQLDDGGWIDRDGDGLLRLWGQVDPRHYLGLPFGAR
ncbi:MAG: hypothetical protein K6U75_16270, partial [Firmicutes bacterium]|nr:hypothetical protein [Bacillota bacterium]